MKYITINNYYTDENTYIIYNDDIKEGIVIDPGTDHKQILKEAEKKGIVIKYIFITHCHYDHISGLIDLKKETGAILGAGYKGSFNIKDPYINLSANFMENDIKPDNCDIIFNENENYELCGMKFICIYTPGHTDCSVCYKFGNILFTGDTLFLRSVGRTDLPTGDQNELENSIKYKLYTLDDNIKVLPGHGRPSEIGYEKNYNLFVRL